MKGRVNAGVACKEMVFDKGLEGDVLLEQDAFAAGIKRHSPRPRITDTGEFERRCKGSVCRFPKSLISQRQSGRKGPVFSKRRAQEGGINQVAKLANIQMWTGHHRFAFLAQLRTDRGRACFWNRDKDAVVRQVQCFVHMSEASALK